MPTSRATSAAGVDLLALVDDHRLDVLDVGAEPLQQGSDRGDQDLRADARDDPAAPLRSRHMARSRRPMVSTLGLTRSKGRVSQAGHTSTCSGPRKAVRSWARRSASVLVGTATSVGRRPAASATPATAKARAGSGTATTPTAQIRGGPRRCRRCAAAAAGAPGWRAAAAPARSDVSGATSPIEPVLGGGDAVGEDALDRVGGHLDADLELGAIPPGRRRGARGRRPAPCRPAACRCRSAPG